MNSIYKLKYIFQLLILAGSSISLFATGYYFNNEKGLDSNSGKSVHDPLKTLSFLDSVQLHPGDSVNFACGSMWKKAAWECVFIIDDSGTESDPITFRSYGKGEKPTFSNGGQVWNKGIMINADYIIIEDLKVIDTGSGGFEIADGADHNIIRNCEVSNCGIGIMCRGSDNLLTRNYIHDLHMIVDNELPDTKKGGGDFGCVAFWLYGPDNEISYNKAINNRGHSYDYQYDGGFLEFYHNCDGTYAHHNWARTGQGIIECSQGHGNDVRVCYNVFLEHMGMFALHDNNFSISNFRFENNTCTTIEGTLWNNMFMNPRGMTIQNNIFVLGGSATEQIANTNDFIHKNNIYYLLDSAGLGSLILSEGEIVADPEFKNLSKYNYTLQKGSPAIDAGKELGYSIDYSGIAVPQGKSPDIGAFEFAGD